MKRTVALLLILSMLGSIAGCASMKQRDTGAIIGAASGAVVGGIIGNKAGSTAAGAIVGAVVGGVAGGYIGNYMDKQAEEMRRDIEGAKIERIGEGIKITFDSGVLFDVDKATLRPDAKTNLIKLSAILNKYQDTDILIEGHTDSTGSEDYNMDLSIRRAQSVSSYLATNKVLPTRFTVVGYGETQPIADNTTIEGRQLNRRVEIAIIANDKLKKIAQEKT
jgi:outer membrane protein OmpA-like peptidoglycan-associated protein